MSINFLKKHSISTALSSALMLILTSQCTKEEKENIGQVFRYNEFSNINSLDPAFASN